MIFEIALGCAGALAGFVGFLRFGKPLLQPKKKESKAPDFMIRQSWNSEAGPEKLLSWIVQNLPSTGNFTLEMYHGVEEKHMERHYLDEILLISLTVMVSLLSFLHFAGR